MFFFRTAPQYFSSNPKQSLDAEQGLIAGISSVQYTGGLPLDLKRGEREPRSAPFFAASSSRVSPETAENLGTVTFVLARLSGMMHRKLKAVQWWVKSIITSKVVIADIYITFWGDAQTWAKAKIDVSRLKKYLNWLQFLSLTIIVIVWICSLFFGNYYRRIFLLNPWSSLGGSLSF